MRDTIVDYLNSFLGIGLLILPILLMPEIRKSKKYIIFVVIASILLFWVGCEKTKRDNKKEAKHEQQRTEDSANLNSISTNYKNDTTRFNDFKKKLENDFHIKDSANAPIQIHNYKPIINTHINKARDVIFN